MPQSLSILMAQINPTVGAIDANTDKIVDIINKHQKHHDLILFPELAVTGYPPEDLLFRQSFHQQTEQALQRIAAATINCHVVIGHPHQENKHCYNSASVFHQTKRIALYHKQLLPNYGVFDELRYFTPGPAKACIFTVNNHRFGLCICEDLWREGPIDQIIKYGADTVLCLNASPFEYDKYQQREKLLEKHASRGLSIIYVNTVGGQDELVFDGQSMALDKKSKLCARAPAMVEHLQTISLIDQQIVADISPLLEQDALIYEALVCGTRDYIEKNGFSGVLLGLSGGIDSALTLAIAVDAIGASRVQAVMMPSRYTAGISHEDALAQIHRLNVEYLELSIEPTFKVLLDTLSPVFSQYKSDTSEENIQARIRGILLMALSNKTGKMVLTTSNKSETAVGFSTLYGDTAGGFAPLKDVLKTQVYQLAQYRNRLSKVIPERVLTRAPSAELAANQTDQDRLPEYSVLDLIINLHLQQNLTADEIIKQGFAAETVNKVLNLIKRNEYKRRQSAPGIKISSRAFDRDWRLPMTTGH